jgi:phthalate 4,5-cis-dihydrodiol dehydrogenase
VSGKALALGIVGLGRAFTLMLPTFRGDTRIRLAGAADPLAAARAQFEADFGAPAHASIEALCADPAIEALYIASPHQLHAEHVAIAAAHGKHVLVEKPMALSLDECSAMIEATRRAGVQLIVGHSHSFNLPVRRTREIIDSGIYGAVKMITALNFTDFLYRPRRPEELDTRIGGGVIHSQAAHQIDIVRLLGGGLVQGVRAFTGAWDPARPTEGAYSALLGFEGGAFASASYSGYGHYDSDELMDNIGELGQVKDATAYGSSRLRLEGLTNADDESSLKAARNYGGAAYKAPAPGGSELAHQHFGPLIVSCEKADLRPGPRGIAIYADRVRKFEPLDSPALPRREVIDELYEAVRLGQPALHDGVWARATTSVCLAILESAASGKECRPAHQVSYQARQTS